MSCPKGKIINPSSGRCVSKTGKIGKSLSKGGKTSKRVSKRRSKSKSKECPEGSKRNPETKRCNKIKSKEPKKIKGKEKSKSLKKKKTEDDIEDKKYLACLEQKCGQKDIVDGYNVLILPKDSQVFHGYGNARVVITDKRPMWFSDPNVATNYARGDPDSCYVYKIKKDLVLVNLADVKNVKKIYNLDQLKPEEQDIISLVTGFNRTDLEEEMTSYPQLHCEYDGKNKNKLMFCPVGFYSSKDHKKKEYINLRLARIVCKLGYDGWFIPKNKVYDAFTRNNYENEVLLCKPKTKLQLVKNEHCDKYNK